MNYVVKNTDNKLYIIEEHKFDKKFPNSELDLAKEFDKRYSNFLFDFNISSQYDLPEHFSSGFGYLYKMKTFYNSLHIRVFAIPILRFGKYEGYSLDYEKLMEINENLFYDEDFKKKNLFVYLKDKYQLTDKETDKIYRWIRKFFIKSEKRILKTFKKMATKVTKL